MWYDARYRAGFDVVIHERVHAATAIGAYVLGGLSEKGSCGRCKVRLTGPRPSTGQTVPGPSNALTETASSDDTDDIGDNVADTPMDVRQRESRRQRYIPESGWTKDDVTMQTITARGPDELMQLDPLPTTIVADVVNYLLNSICNADVVSVNFSMSRKPALLAKNFLDLHVLSYMDNMALQTDVADGEAYPAVKLLGFLVDGFGMSTTDDRAAAITKIEQPQNLATLEMYIGMVPKGLNEDLPLQQVGMEAGTKVAIYTMKMSD
ncbi:hypothetical protein CIB48_g2620 [Xylaria polymorpha]|nr:hypothetical protein CIB48_g2620 [Xylaria polymorpha]